MALFTPIESYSSFRRVALAQWSNCTEATIQGALYLDVTQTSEYLKKLKQENQESVSYGVLVGKAVTHALTAMPEINAKIFGRKIYKKRTFDIFYQVDINEGSDLSGVVVTDTDQKSLLDIARFLRERAEKLRSGKDEQYEKTQKGGLFKVLPIWCLALLFKLYAFLLYRVKVPPRWLGSDLIDPFGSVMVTNVGKFGVDVAYAPLIRWTHVPLIVLVGTAREMPTVVDGELCVRTMLPVSATIDHRLLDGAHVGKLSKIMRSYVEDPEGFEKNLAS